MSAERDGNGDVQKAKHLFVLVCWGRVEITISWWFKRCHRSKRIRASYFERNLIVYFHNHSDTVSNSDVICNQLKSDWLFYAVCTNLPKGKKLVALMQTLSPKQELHVKFGLSILSSATAVMATSLFLLTNAIQLLLTDQCIPWKKWPAPHTSAQKYEICRNAIFNRNPVFCIASFLMFKKNVYLNKLTSQNALREQCVHGETCQLLWKLLIGSNCHHCLFLGISV